MNELTSQMNVNMRQMNIHIFITELIQVNRTHFWSNRRKQVSNEGKYIYRNLGMRQLNVNKRQVNVNVFSSSKQVSTARKYVTK
jgi:hypothetical protein